MSLRINDTILFKPKQSPYESELLVRGEHIPYTSKVEMIMDCQDKDEVTKLIITIHCIKIENEEEEE